MKHRILYFTTKWNLAIL